MVTSAEANAFPANLPVGSVHYAGGWLPEVEPAARLQKLEVVRMMVGFGILMSVHVHRDVEFPGGASAGQDDCIAAAAA